MEFLVALSYFSNDTFGMPPAQLLGLALSGISAGVCLWLRFGFAAAVLWGFAFMFGYIGDQTELPMGVMVLMVGSFVFAGYRMTEVWEQWRGHKETEDLQDSPIGHFGTLRVIEGEERRDGGSLRSP